jgi:hypothetical protein
MTRRPLRTTLATGAAAALGVLALSAAAALPASAAPGTAGRGLTTTLAGENEVGPAGGDPDGTGAARLSVNYGQSRLCYSITVADIGTAVMAHVHEGAAGTNGPVVIGLMAPGADGTSSGCVTVERSILKGILQDPAEYYVNVHTAAFPGGAVRGQL